MNDLATHLRNAATDWDGLPGHDDEEIIHYITCKKAREIADHIEAQAKIIDELSEALRPFALVEIWDISASEHDLDLYKPMPEQYAAGGVLRVRDFRKASETWAKVPDRFLPKSSPNTPERNDE